MSRHRNVRALNAEDEFEGVDDVYGHSYDEGTEFGMSPGTTNQFMYNRDKSNLTFATIIGTKDSIEEEPDEFQSHDDTFPGRSRELSGGSSEGGGGGGNNPGDGFGSHSLQHPSSSDSWRRKTSQDFVRPQLSEADQVRLRSCVEEIQNVLGDSIPECSVIHAVVVHHFDFEKTLDFLLQQDGGSHKKNADEEVFAAVGTTKNIACSSKVVPPLAADDPSLAADSVPSSSKLFPSFNDLPLTIPSPAAKSPFPFVGDDHLSSSPKIVLASPKPQRSVKKKRKDRPTKRRDDDDDDRLDKDDDDDDADAAAARRKREGETKDDIAETFGCDEETMRTSLEMRGGDDGDDDCLESAGGEIRKPVEESPSKQLRSIQRLKVDDAFGGSGSEDERDAIVGTPPPPGSAAAKTTNPHRRLKDRLRMLERYAERLKEMSKNVVNLVVVGHVDSGKSTLMGHLLFKTGNVSKRNMHKFEQESKKAGKASFAYAWVLDETEDERSRGVTIDIAQSKFETERQSINLLDAPGHRDFIPNMITGAAQADAAILVVNSTRGEFESGYEAGGQTREHGLLVRSLGVSQIIVAVNKLDTVDWDQKRYQEIVKKMSVFLRQIGYKEEDISFVPCSGLLGHNLTKGSAPPELSSWYSTEDGVEGPSLIERIDGLQPFERPVDKPLRLCVADIFKGIGSGLCASGKVEAGAVTGGDRTVVMPSGQVAQVKAVSIDDSPVDYGFAGDQVVVTLVGVNETAIAVGSVICDIEDPIKVTHHFLARIVVFNINFPLTQGYPLVFHLKSFNEPCVLKKLVSLINKATGEETKRRPKCLTKGASAMVEVAFARQICVELYKDMKELGRFMLRCGDNTVGAGMVTSIIA